MKVPADPLEAFLSGIGSVVGRTLLSFAAVAAGFGVCLIATGQPTDTAEFWGILLIGILFWWGAFGGWFFVGFLSLISMFVLICAFAYDWHPQGSLYGVFSAAVICYSPLTFPEQHWINALGIWTGVSLCYWAVPLAVSRRIQRKSDSIGGRHAD